MEPGPYEQVPLTDDDKDMLYTVYDSRRRFLISVYIFLIALGLFKPITAIMSLFVFTNSKLPGLGSIFISSLPGVIFLESIIIGSGLYLLKVRVLPFKKDIDNGVKEKIPFIVTGKQYFPLTSQYFLNLADDKYQNHETDEATYNNVNEGDAIYLFRAISSKYFFEISGRFSII